LERQKAGGAEMRATPPLYGETHENASSFGSLIRTCPELSGQLTLLREHPAEVATLISFLLPYRQVETAPAPEICPELVSKGHLRSPSGRLE
jgi:hypothetical protein